MDMSQLTEMTVTLAGWSVAGIAALFASRKIYDVMTPFVVDKELIQDKNTAVGYSKALFMVAVAIILHGVISGDKVSNQLWVEAVNVGVLLSVALVILALGRLVLVKTTKCDFDHEIHEVQNTALGLVEGGWYVALAIIIHAAV